MIYQDLVSNKKAGRKQFAVLIDPDNVQLATIPKLVDLAHQAGVDYFFVGGSLILNDHLDSCVHQLKRYSSIPVVLFPGSTFQLSYAADAVLFLSLISGRNPELLIGKQVTAAPYLQQSQLEVLPTGYMLVDGGALTSVSYISHTFPIPHNKTPIAVATALAGTMLGLRLIYMDAGSGAQKPISNSMIKAVSQNVDVPLIVGGGIRTPETAYEKARAGADVIVVGNAIERDPALLLDLAHAIHSLPKRENERLSMENES
ncbi:MAG: geranylgeranylglyceryl/heptaprenylglyceryl phosphate synthase [Bacteroidota bacterium]